MGKGIGAADIQWVKARDTAKDTTMHWTTPHIKELSGPKGQ